MATKTLFIKWGAGLFNRPLLTLSYFLWSSLFSEKNTSSGDFFDFVDEFQVSSQLDPLKRSACEL